MLTHACPGGRIASKRSAPNMPKLERVKVPAIRTTKVNTILHARFCKEKRSKLPFELT
ncbi:hypothetical protein Hanom_Chr12g01092881 [Helianthus anomalus]